MRRPLICCSCRRSRRLPSPASAQAPPPRLPRQRRAAGAAGGRVSTRRDRLRRAADRRLRRRGRFQRFRDLRSAARRSIGCAITRDRDTWTFTRGRRSRRLSRPALRGRVRAVRQAQGVVRMEPGAAVLQRRHPHAVPRARRRASSGSTTRSGGRAERHRDGRPATPAELRPFDIAVAPRRGRRAARLRPRRAISTCSSRSPARSARASSRGARRSASATRSRWPLPVDHRTNDLTTAAEWSNPRGMVRAGLRRLVVQQRASRR